MIKFRRKTDVDPSQPVNKVFTERLEDLTDDELAAGVRLVHWAFAAHYREVLRRITQGHESEDVKKDRVARLNTKTIEQVSPYVIHEIAHRRAIRSTRTSERMGMISLLIAFTSLMIAFITFMMQTAH